eukprot:207805-Prorocentrum_minimum.AAC.3
MYDTNPQSHNSDHPTWVAPSNCLPPFALAYSPSLLGLDTDTVELTDKTLLSELTTGEFNSPPSFRGHRMSVLIPTSLPPTLPHPHVLQVLTYNKRLKAATRGAIERLNLRNIKAHTFHAAAQRYWAQRYRRPLRSLMGFRV